MRCHASRPVQRRSGQDRPERRDRGVQLVGRVPARRPRRTASWPIRSTSRRVGLALSAMPPEAATKRQRHQPHGTKRLRRPSGPARRAQVVPGPTPRRRASSRPMTAAAAAEITPPASRLIRGPNCSATQPTSGEPSGAPPRKTSMYRPITRPRMSGVVPSWTVEFAAVLKVSRVRPVGTSRTRNSQNYGISAVSISSTPNANAAVTSSRRPGPAAPGREQRAGQRAGREHGRGDAERAGPGVEHLPGHQRVGDLEVHPEGGHEEDQHHRHQQVRAGPARSEALPQLAPGPGHRLDRMQLTGPHQLQAGQHRAVGRRVDEERGRRADRADDQPGDGRPGDPGQVEDRAVQRDRVGHVGPADHLGHERLPGRVVHHGDQAEPEGQRVDLPDRAPRR